MNVHKAIKNFLLRNFILLMFRAVISVNPIIEEYYFYIVNHILLPASQHALLVYSKINGRLNSVTYMDIKDLVRTKRRSSIRIEEKCKDEVHEWNEPHILVELTLAILKPDVVEYHNEIEDMISRYGFSILQKRNLRLSEEHVEEFYNKCLDKTFLSDLKKYLTSDLSRVLLLARRNAIKRWLMIIGPDNSYTAKETHPKSLRAIYGTDDMKNAVHGSENAEEALREISYFFPTRIIEPLLNESGAKKFLAKYVNKTLVQALKALCYAKPSDPLIWLADWLLENNPYKPDVNPIKYYVQ